MSLFGDRFKRNTEDNEGDPMLPFMSLLLIIIPILITNLSFYHLRAVGVNTPGRSDNEEVSENSEKDLPLDTKVMLQLNIDPETVYLDLINEGTGEVVTKFSTILNDQAPLTLREKVLGYRKKYEKLDTMMISIDDKVQYKDIVAIMDECKRDDEELEELAKRLPSSDEVKKEKGFMLVLLPRAGLSHEESLDDEEGTDE